MGAAIGINISQYIEDEKTNNYYILNQKVTNMYSDEEYQDMFVSLKNKNILLNEKYTDRIWIFIDKIGYKRNIVFDLDLRPQMGEMLKKYTLVMFCKKMVEGITIQNKIFNIKRELFNTHYLDKDYYLSYVESIHIEDNRYYDFLEFLKFANLDGGAKYIELLDNMPIRPEKKPRDLPCYQSIILFDYIIDDFIKTHNIGEKIKYYPVLIWWKLSSIIPLRPGEVYQLPKNCIFEDNGKFYIHIERIKNKFKRRKLSKPIVKDFEIKQETYEIILNYISFIKEFDDGEFLFSTNVLQKCSFTTSRIGDNTSKLTHKLMETIYKHFLKEVVEDIYGYHIVPLGQRKNDNDIEKIKMGDVRHLAIINMMMLGYNPLYIMELAGHTKLETQMGYYNHVETFATAKTNVLKNMIMKNKELAPYSIDDASNNTPMNGLIQRELLGSSYYSLPLVMNGKGRCKNSDAPIGCVSNGCLFCQYFIGEQNLSNESYEYQKKKLDNDMELYKMELSYLMRDRILDIMAFDEVGQKIGVTLNKKIVLDAYKSDDSIYENKIIEGEDTNG